MSAEIVKAYPLQWPTGWKRTEPNVRRDGQFSKASRSYSNDGQSSWMQYRDLTIAEANARVIRELKRMGVVEEEMVISTNLRLGLGGLPLSKQSMPTDPGVAVYWREGRTDARRCMAIDRYARVEHNLAAVAATLEAMRAIERHGGAEILDRAFTGFTALPAPMAAQRPWRDVLQCGALDATVASVQSAYRRRRGETHPDRPGGDHDAFLAVQAAYEQAARELGFQP